MGQGLYINETLGWQEMTEGGEGELIGHRTTPKSRGRDDMEERI